MGRVPHQTRHTRPTPTPRAPIHDSFRKPIQSTPSGNEFQAFDDACPPDSPCDAARRCASWRRTRCDPVGEPGGDARHPNGVDARNEDGREAGCLQLADDRRADRAIRVAVGTDVQMRRGNRYGNRERGHGQGDECSSQRRPSLQWHCEQWCEAPADARVGDETTWRHWIRLQFQSLGDPARHSRCAGRFPARLAAACRRGA